jgi:hypothetical protein
VSVNSTHGEYDASAASWSRARDVLFGEDAVKAAGERYPPRLDSQADEDSWTHNAPVLLKDGETTIEFR